MKDDLALHRKNRLQLLLRLYEMTDGDRSKRHSIWNIGDELGYSQEEIKKYDQYLEGEGLIESVALRGVVKITHEGIKKVEKTLEAAQAGQRSEMSSVTVDDALDLEHSDDYLHVRLPRNGRTYNLTSQQAEVVKALHEAEDYELSQDWIMVGVLNYTEVLNVPGAKKIQPPRLSNTFRSKSKEGYLGNEGDDEALIVKIEGVRPIRYRLNT